jgi:hypothetical protein
MTTPEPSGRFDVVKESGITADIMQAIFDTFQNSYRQTEVFAREFRLKCNCTHKILKNIWQFAKENIKYKLDPIGNQFIKTPSVTIRDGFGDCKAYSILIASLLKNLSIPFVFRLVTYDPSNTDVTHIYVVAKLPGEEIPIDACLSQFGVEKKPYYLKTDINMTKIIAVSGTSSPQKITTKITKYEIDPAMNAGVLDLLLTREQLELERAIKVKKGQIGDIGAVNEEIAILNKAIMMANRNQNISGLADFIGRRKPGGTKVGNFLRKVSKTVKSGLKAVAKTLTFPMRLAIKGILELKLPKAAYYFLPLFATDSQAQKIGSAFVRERKRAQKRANFIIKVIGMKENHFMKIVRNGIMKRKGKSPEQIINNLTIKGAKISGIGIPPALALQAAPMAKEATKDILAPLFELINKLLSLFKKEKADPEITTSEAALFAEPGTTDAPLVNFDNSPEVNNSTPNQNNPQNPITYEPADRNESTKPQRFLNEDSPPPPKSSNTLLIGAAIVGGLLLANRK